MPRKRKNPSEYYSLLLPMVGIEPRPPEQQASALSITPLHLSINPDLSFVADADVGIVVADGAVVGVMILFLLMKLYCLFCLC